MVAVIYLADEHEPYRQTALLPQAIWPFMVSRGLSDIAVEVQLRALRTAERLADRALTAYSHNYLAGAYYLQSRFAKSAEHLTAAYGLFTTLGDRPAAAAVLCNAAIVYYRRGRLQQALESARRGEEMFDSSDAFHAQNGALLGEVYQTLQQYDLALTAFRRGQRAARARGSHVAAAMAIASLGHVHLDLNHLTVAAGSES